MKARPIHGLQSKAVRYNGTYSIWFTIESCTIWRHVLSNNSFRHHPSNEYQTVCGFVMS